MQSASLPWTLSFFYFFISPSKSIQSFVFRPTQMSLHRAILRCRAVSLGKLRSLSSHEITYPSFQHLRFQKCGNRDNPAVPSRGVSADLRTWNREAEKILFLGLDRGRNPSWPNEIVSRRHERLGSSCHRNFFDIAELEVARSTKTVDNSSGNMREFHFVGNSSAGCGIYLIKSRNPMRHLSCGERLPDSRPFPNCSAEVTALKWTTENTWEEFRSELYCARTDVTGWTSSSRVFFMKPEPHTHLRHSFIHAE